MTHVDDARKLRWYCELCERTHPIGEHDPGKSWLPAPQCSRRPARRPASARVIYLPLPLRTAPVRHSRDRASRSVGASSCPHRSLLQDEIPRMPGNPTGGGH